MAEPGPPDAAEQEVGTDCATLGDPRAKHARRRAGQRRAALLTTLAVAANVGDGEEEQRVVAATESGGRVWRCEERVDFGGGEEGDEVTVEALLRDGEDALDQSRVRWLAAGREAEERVDRREPRVACPDAVAALLLEVIEEGADERRVDVREEQGGRRLADVLLGETEE